MSLAEEIAALPAEMQQEVADFVGYLQEKNKRKKMGAQRQWREIAGLSEFPLTSEDAQTWVTSQRQSDDRNHHQT